MDVNIYQRKASRTLLKEVPFEMDNVEMMLVWNAIGVAGEAGEVAELAKKQIFHQHDIDTEKWKKELGDVLWYVAALCSHLGITMAEVMEANIIKLEARFPNGFTSEDSKNRTGAAE